MLNVEQDTSVTIPSMMAALSKDVSSLKVVHISLYCYRNFPIRIFHSMTQKAGADSHAFFLKNSAGNRHKTLTETELDLLIDSIEDLDPDLVTLSVLAPYVETAIEVISRVRRISSAPVLVGGKYPTINPQGALKFADYVCKQEGEFVFLEVLDRLAKGQDLTGITGLWHMDENGDPVDMGQQSLIQNLDEVPAQAVGAPNMYFIEDDRLTEADPEANTPMIFVMAGRGCVYQCTFCVNSLLIPMNKGNGKFVRILSPEMIIREIEDRVALLPAEMRERAYVDFGDEIFGVMKDWTAEFVELYKERINLPFSCEMIPKLIKEENIEILAEVGLSELNFGIQSGVDEIRKDTFNRPGNNVELVEKAEILNRHNVLPRYDIILQNPFETAEMLHETLKLLDQFPHPISMNVFRLQFFPHYPITLEALKKGIITEADLTHEKVAEMTMKNWNFKPAGGTFDKKAQYENAIFLLGWAGNSFNRWLCRMFSNHPNHVFGLTIGLLAEFFYRVETGNTNFARWMRRGRAATSLILSGNFKELFKSTARMTKRIFSSPTNTCLKGTELAHSQRAEEH